MNLHAIVDAFRHLPGREPEAPEVLRPKVAAALAGHGVLIPDAPTSSGAPGALLLCASRNAGSLAAYEIPAAPDAETAKMVAAVSGAVFAALEDLEASVQSDAARFLLATHTTGLSPEEVAEWLQESGADQVPSVEDLEDIEDHMGSMYRGEAFHGEEALEIEDLGPFDRVLVVTYDGE
jgi:hypothetical protein